jgi:SAM-dependent methyltransferase
VSKYDAKASRWTEGEYADARAYLEHRARVVVELGPRLAAGDRVCDLACGDGGFGEHLVARGLEYLGVDASEAMVEAARRRLDGHAEIVQADLNAFAPAEPVAAVTCFRAIYYAQDRAAFFRRVGAFAERKLVFDLNPRQFRLDDVVADLRVAGFDQVDRRPFFVPQRGALPRPAAAALRAAERAGPLARLALRYRFTYVVAASRRP